MIAINIIVILIALFFVTRKDFFKERTTLEIVILVVAWLIVIGVNLMDIIN